MSRKVKVVILRLYNNKETKLETKKDQSREEAEDPQGFKVKVVVEIQDF